MATCLEDLKASVDNIETVLQQIANSIVGIEAANVDIDINTSASARAGSSSVAHSSALAIAYAQAEAIAVNILRIDVRVQQTQVVRLQIPPVSITQPPNVIDYPPTETGITDTPATTETDGELCQLLHHYVTQVEQFCLYLSQSPMLAVLFAAPAVILSQIELVLKMLVSIAGGLVSMLISPDGLVQMASTLAQVQLDGSSPTDLLANVSSLVTANHDDIVCNLYGSVINDVNTYFAIVALDDYFSNTLMVSPEQSAILTVLFSPTWLGAAIYLPQYGTLPVTTFDCGCSPD